MRREYLPGDVANLHTSHTDYAAVAVLSTVPLAPRLLLRLKALCDLLHHLELLGVGEVTRGGVVAEDVGPDVDAGPVHEPLLHVGKHLVHDPLEGLELGMGDAVLTHNLVPQDTSELGQGLEVGDVDDQRPEVVIENQTQRLQEVIQLTIVTLIAFRTQWRSKELGVKLIFIFADVKEEGAAGPEKYCPMRREYSGHVIIIVQ